MAPHDGPNGGRRRGRIVFIAGVVLVSVSALTLAMAPRLGDLVGLRAPLPTMRPSSPPEDVRSVSIDFGVVTDPDTDWDGVRGRLDAAAVTTVNLNAGRVEFTAFDWAEHPEAAAVPGTDHLAAAAVALTTGPAGQQRQVNLIVDAFVPEWAKADPSIAGIAVDGRRALYSASASQLAEGPVGQRLVDYVVALGERYDPNRIELTELFLSTYTFGDDDLALFRRMTGAKDWPRADGGSIDAGSRTIAAWRSDVLAGLAARIRRALDTVRDGAGRAIELGLDVRVDWDHPASGRPWSGHDYRRLLETGVVLQPWVYIGSDDRKPRDIKRFTAALAAAGYDMSRFVMSVGLWDGPADADPPGRITPDDFEAAVAAAATHGVRAVNVTPYSLLTDDHWAALVRAWG